METCTSARLHQNPTKLVPSEAVSVACAHFGVCGGCHSQDVAYVTQLQQKERAVRHALESLEGRSFHPIIPSPEIYFYRNKMEFSFGDERDIALIQRSVGAEFSSGAGDLAMQQHSVHLGLHPRRRFAVVTPTPSCQLQSLESQKILQCVAQWATTHRIPIYLRKDNSGILRHLVIREGKNTGERMVNLFSTSGLSPADVDVLAKKLEKADVAITTFLWTIHDGVSDVAHGSDGRVYWGPGFIRERVGQIVVKVNPSSFMQTNTRASERMIETLQRWIQTTANDRGTLVDLYCGVGVIGLNMAASFDRLVGIEINEDAVSDARSNAVYNGYLRAEFVAGRAEDLTAVFSSIDDIHRATVIVDPPRAGLHTRVIEALLASAPARICYVSCNPESLSRDLRRLVSKYTIQEIQPLDFFPHTLHVETAVFLEKQ